MKKSILAVAMLLFVGLSFSPKEAEAYQNYEFAINSYFTADAEILRTKFCSVQECTDIKGSGCDTPGSAIRGCWYLYWF